MHSPCNYTNVNLSYVHRVIEDLLKSYEEETEYMKIPPLGVHYTKRWAEEDLLEEQNEGDDCYMEKKT